MFINITCKIYAQFTVFSLIVANSNFLSKTKHTPVYNLPTFLYIFLKVPVPVVPM